MLEYRCCTMSGYFSINVVHYILVVFDEQTVPIVHYVTVVYDEQSVAIVQD